MSEAPTRVATLDVIRGVAVMGILLMNIVAFAMPEVAYMNPAAFGSRGPADYAVWAINFVLVDGKMRGLFSFLFGASMLLVIERAEAKGESAARVHYARMACLLLFGIVHLYFVWWGDILQHYALVGMLAFGFYRMPVHRLVIAALILIGLQTGFSIGMAQDIASSQAAIATHHADATMLGHYRGYIEAFGRPDSAFLARDIAVHRGSYAAIVADRLASQVTSPLQTLVSVGMETLGYMLLGMACFQTGMLRGDWPRARYRRWLVAGFGIGIPVYAVLAALQVRGGFSAYWVAFCALGLSTPIRPLMIIGWVSLVVLLVRPGGPVSARIGAAGRMAFSNYLGTSLICSTLFYGYGGALYGQFSRAELYIVVAAIWALMLLWSKPWLDRFRYGPMEWAWRSLARWRFQPMRGAAGA